MNFLEEDVPYEASVVYMVLLPDLSATQLMEIAHWCIDTNIHPNYIRGYPSPHSDRQNRTFTQYAFSKQEDAAFFTLRWKQWSK